MQLEGIVGGMLSKARRAGSSGGLWSLWDLPQSLAKDSTSQLDQGRSSSQEDCLFPGS